MGLQPFAHRCPPPPTKPAPSTHAYPALLKWLLCCSCHEADESGESLCSVASDSKHLARARTCFLRQFYCEIDFACGLRHAFLGSTAQNRPLPSTVDRRTITVHKPPPRKGEVHPRPPIGRGDRTFFDHNRPQHDLPTRGHTPRPRKGGVRVRCVRVPSKLRHRPRG